MNNFELLKEKLARRNSERPASPLEKWVKMFLQHCNIHDYVTEHQVDYYFIDIAWPHLKFGVELDGKDFHQNKQRDDSRDLFLQNKGWEIKRIPSSECWKVDLMAVHLKEIFKKVYPERLLTYGLAELIGCENYLAPIAKTDEERWNNLIYCYACDISHFAPEHTKDYILSLMKK